MFCYKWGILITNIGKQYNKMPNPAGTDIVIFDGHDFGLFFYFIQECSCKYTCKYLLPLCCFFIDVVCEHL